MSSWIDELIPRDGFRTTEQLVSAGVTPSALSRATSTGRLHRIYPEHYARSPRERLTLATVHEAALSHAGEGAFLDCASAASAWDLLGQRPTDVHVGALDRRLRRVDGLRPHYYDTLDDAVQTRSGLLVVKRELAVVRAFGCLGVDDGRAMVLSATQQRRLRPDDVVPFVGDGAKYRNQLLDVLELARGGSHSKGEVALLVDALLDYGLPMPERQFPLVLADGRVIYLDAAYRKARVGLEHDGREWHFNAHARNLDIARDADAAAVGWLILRCTAYSRRDRRRWAQRVCATVESRGGF